MKKIFNKIKNHITLYNSILFVIFLLLNFILYLLNIRFRFWFIVLILIFLLIGFIIGTIQILVNSFKTMKIVISFVSFLMLFLGLISIKIFDFTYYPEHTVTIENKKYVAIVKAFEIVDVSYYDYYGPILMGIKERIHSNFGKGNYDPFENPNIPSSVEQTYYDNSGKVIRITNFNFVKDKNGKIVDTNSYDIYNNSLYHIHESDKYLLPEDEEVLYEKKFDNIILRFGKVDNVLGQNILVNVLRSTDNGKNFYFVSDETIKVSNEAKFVFLNENLGFAISNGKIYLNNSGTSLYVTNDGGKTFTSATFNYKNEQVDYISIIEVPYYDENNLKIKCSVYQINSNLGGYEDKELIFVSNDNGLTWNLASN